MPTAQHHNFVVKNGLEVKDSIKLGSKTITNFIDSAEIALIARSVAVDSAGDLTGLADPAGTAVALAIALG